MSPIKNDEYVVFFPTVARLSDDHESWIVPIHGWIFEPEEDDTLRNLLIGQIRSLADLDPEATSTKLFDKRIRYFLVDCERNKRIGIEIAGQEHVLDPSSADGHFTGALKLPLSTVEPFLRDGVLRYHAITDDADDRVFEGVSYCLLPEGISVISDIDDTIKVTEVRDKQAMFENTLCREFEAVPDMSSVYRRWSAAGAAFHYVSASPCHLYQPLTEFVQQARFPSGSMHLKRFRFIDRSVLELFQDPGVYKMPIIESLLKAFPERQFILVGDSGDRDPETYVKAARLFPSQISRIYIRDVTGERQDSARYRNAFGELSTDVWTVFEDADELEPLGN